MSQSTTRTYERHACITFRKTDEAFGGLSNMAPGFSLKVNGILIRTSEALYQACRFPRMPDVQRLIIEQKSPMTAKMKSKPYRAQSRPDWERVRVKVMTWCLRVKLAQNWSAFGGLLLSTGELPIVEESTKDDFWGAKAVEDNKLRGNNVLGRLLMKLREDLRGPNSESLRHVEPLALPDFLLLGQPIAAIGMRGVPRGAYAPVDGAHMKASREHERVWASGMRSPHEGGWGSTREAPLFSGYRSKEISSPSGTSVGSFAEERGDRLLIARRATKAEIPSVPLSLASEPPSRIDAALGEVIISQTLNPANPRDLDEFLRRLRERLISLGLDQAKVELVVCRIK